MPEDARPKSFLTQCCSLATGDAFLILASDGLLQAATPAEVCSLAHALALGMPLPKPLTAAPVATPLGPSAAAGLPSQQPLVAPSQPSNCTGSRKRAAFSTGSSCHGPAARRSLTKLQVVLVAGQIQHCTECELDCEATVQTAATRAQAVADGWAHRSPATHA